MWWGRGGHVQGAALELLHVSAVSGSEAWDETHTSDCVCPSTGRHTELEGMVCCSFAAPQSLDTMKCGAVAMQ